MIPTFNQQRYGQLLADTLPAVITTEAEYDRILAIAEKLTFSETLEPEEEMLLDLLVQLIEQYEEKNYPIPEVEPHVMLQHLIESKEIRQADLVGIIGSSGVVSEVVNGKRAISKAQAKALGDYFQISPSVFI
jgi:HTH-type transcriptional regulator/antitoxin HigA